MRRHKLLLAEDNPDHLKLLLFNLLNARPESDVTAASCGRTLIDAARSDPQAWLSRQIVGRGACAHVVEVALVVCT